MRQEIKRCVMTSSDNVYIIYGIQIFIVYIVNINTMHSLSYLAAFYVLTDVFLYDVCDVLYYYAVCVFFVCVMYLCIHQVSNIIDTNIHRSTSTILKLSLFFLLSLFLLIIFFSLFCYYCLPK